MITPNAAALRMVIPYCALIKRLSPDAIPTEPDGCAHQAFRYNGCWREEIEDVLD